MPKFKCKPECGECCGITFLPRSTFINNLGKMQVELETLEEFKTDVVPMTADGMCVFLNRTSKMCEIYSQRPPVCEAFGVTENISLMCPYFKPNGNKWSEAKKKRLQRQLKKWHKHVLSDLDKYAEEHYKK